MPTELEPIAESPGLPGCQDCGPRQEPVEPSDSQTPEAPHEAQPTNGADVAVTLFLPGVGNGIGPNDRIDYSVLVPGPGGSQVRVDRTQLFQDRLAALFRAPPDGTPCCRRFLYRAHYDPFDSAYHNAEELAELLWSELQTLAREPWVRKIYVHLIGHSAGGIVAVNILQEIRDEYACEIAVGNGRRWCNAPIPANVPLSFDIVTMATPFRCRVRSLLDPPVLTPLFESAAFLGRLAAPLLGPLARLVGLTYYEFAASIGENDYGDDEHPPCLCGFVAFDSSRAQGDAEAGDRDPSRDDRLRDADSAEDWNPQTVKLANLLPGETYLHDEVPLRILDDDEARSKALFPGCRCVELP